MVSADIDAGTTSATRVADVLLLFLDSNDTSLGVTTIARRLGLSKAVVHRILVSLVSRGLLVPDSETRRYRLGAAAAVGARALCFGAEQTRSYRAMVRDGARDVSGRLGWHSPAPP